MPRNKGASQLMVGLLVMVAIAMILFGALISGQPVRHTVHPASSGPIGLRSRGLVGSDLSNTALQSVAAQATRSQYELVVTWDAERKAASVEQRVTYINQSSEFLDHLLFVVEPNRYAGTFRLDSVHAADGQEIENYVLYGNMLQVVLPAPLPPGHQLTLGLDYVLMLPNRQGVFGYTRHQSNFGDWYPFVPPYREGEGWIAHPPADMGEHLVYDMADYEVEIRLDEAGGNRVVIAASAPAAVEKNHHRYSIKAARNFTWSASEQYSVLKTGVGDVVIQGYFFPSHLAAGRVALQATAQALALYSARFAPYPHQSLTLVEANFPDGLEYDGLFFLDRSYFAAFDAETEEGFLIPLAAHETAHQWWYALVANDQAEEPWLDEALAVYSELLFYEEYYPTKIDWWWEYRVHRFAPTGSVSSTIYEHDAYRQYVDAVYLRGALFLHELRRYLGDDDFYRFLHEYANRYQGRQVSSEDFWGLLNEVELVERDVLQATFFSVDP